MDKPTLDKIEALAGRGLTEQQIADALGIDIEKIRRDKTEISAYRSAIRRGKAKGIADLSNALFIKAKKGDTRAMIFLLEHLKPKA
ncbi:Uncharacterised protein [Serratia entomophila]|jgi:transcriptional regulator with XRE-family HTH domain|uniref:hypothetical protein n=1 Tax=Serratia entomophila TaxID=42906 RepID=UPI001F2E05D0|nr:hypothetical protein [Serratia entomophila]UIW20218.1 hypothetical protein KHA73_09900 [Serratia entomophila]CAI0775669.1 Uncharacterised protein [Serratia entomophila]CAI0793591.1 Uncharacterised protein [Serratia entomophila]CAI0807359.1 Uncharacterised protein [Serratia entomophila]CAI0815036.1 Uncharacterised protein [Serratia entomophila]